MRWAPLKWYPDQSLPMLRRLLTDLLVGLWVLVWAAFGYLVYRTTLALEAIANGITSAGEAFNRWVQAFRSVTPQGIPGVSDFLNGLANAVQRGSGNQLLAAGAEVHDAIFRLAVVLGLLTALPPILLALAAYLPGRAREAREMGSALAFVRNAQLSGAGAQAQALLAYRAVATLSFTELMKTSRDPVGDLTAHRYDRLANAMLRRAGLDPYRLPSPELEVLPPEPPQARLGRPRSR